MVLLAIYTFLVSLGKRNLSYPILTGISFGLACLTRPTNAGLIVLFLLLYLYKKKLENLILFIGTAFFISIPQFIYNWYFYGHPLKFTTFFKIERSYANEFIEMLGHSLPVFSINNFFFLLQQIVLKFSFVFLLLIFTIFLIIIYSLFRLYRESPEAAVVLSFWILPYLVIYGTYPYFYNSILHFLMPIIPALIIIISLALRRFLWFP